MSDRDDRPDGEAERPRIVEEPRTSPPVDPHAWRDAPPLVPDPRDAALGPDEDAALSLDEEDEDDGELEIDPDYEPPELVVIRTYNNGLEAEIARNDLVASGIPAVIFAGGGHMLPYLQFSGGVRLAVPDWAVEDADLLLQPFEEDDAEEEDEEEQ